MLGKLLLTITIIVLAALFLRKHRENLRRQQRQGHAAPALPTAEAATQLNDYRFAAWLFLTLIIGAGAWLYYLQWQDDSTLITVVLHRDGAGSPVTYQVYKHQLEERAFTTVDGVRVTVAASERMEVIGL